MVMGSQREVMLSLAEAKTRIKRFLTVLLLPTEPTSWMETYRRVTNEKQHVIFRSYFFAKENKCHFTSFFFFFFNRDTAIVKKVLLLQRDPESENSWKNEMSFTSAINFQFLPQELRTSVVLQCTGCSN